MTNQIPTPLSGPIGDSAISGGAAASGPGDTSPSDSEGNPPAPPVSFQPQEMTMNETNGAKRAYTIRTEEAKHALMNEFRASGLSMTEFSKRKGLSASLLFSWLKKEGRHTKPRSHKRKKVAAPVAQNGNSNGNGVGYIQAVITKEQGAIRHEQNGTLTVIVTTPAEARKYVGKYVKL